MNDRIGVFVLDVGQGDCTIVLLPDHRAVIFDCKDDHVLRKTLDCWKIRTIEAFVLSHLDQDHIAGALQFLMQWPHTIKCVYLSADRDISHHHADAQRAKKLVDYVTEQSRDEGVRPRRWELVANARDPRPLAEGDKWSVRLLAPLHAQVMKRERGDHWEDANRYSSILRVEAGGNVMLIGGDAPLLSWSELPAAELPARVFRVPHHGGALNDGGVPSGWDVARLYREVDPEAALVSVGTNNNHGHPDENWIGPLMGSTHGTSRCRLLCTQVTARCHPPFDAADEIVARRKLVIRQQNQWTEPQWRHLTDRRQMKDYISEIPCAGTIVVSLHMDKHIHVLPSRGGAHERIVDNWENPLCRGPL